MQLLNKAGRQMAVVFAINKQNEFCPVAKWAHSSLIIICYGCVFVIHLFQLSIGLNISMTDPMAKFNSGNERCNEQNKHLNECLESDDDKASYLIPDFLKVTSRWIYY